MDVKTVQDRLKVCLDNLASSPKIQVCFGIKAKGKDPNIFRIEVSDGLADTFFSIFSSAVANLNRDINTNGVELHPYDAGSNPLPHEIEVLVDETGSTAPARVTSALKNISELKPYSGARGQTDFSFYTMAIQTDDGIVAQAFRKISRTNELTRGRGFLAFLEKGTFDQVRNPVFQFDNSIDCLAIDGTFIILNQKNFHYIFNYFEQAAAAAKETIDNIAARIPIQGVSDFENDCMGNSVILLKLKSISSSDNFDKITIDKIAEIVSELNLPVEIIEENGIKKILYNKDHKWHIIRLLDDAYLRSMAMNMVYQVGSKRPVS